MVQDAEDTPLPALESLSKRIKPYGLRSRLPQTEAILRERPNDMAASELYLQELILRSLKPRGGQQCLDGVFSIAVNGIAKETLNALPKHTQIALFRLASMSLDEPVALSDARGLAHALTINGKLVDWLTSEQTKAA